ncbi:hypothetical protein CQA53_11010 [Helicobacter didelphidarum]|uniref:Uncharacterized protein n=1 Tax=Helicobacter didelphidarum TaxID=2040648 RepID=A0A3D8I643_9HELI|nr:hypothetical protein [Helicobacter didelphidarum]RDU60214.1 hypothetical protein CQA53_11010 [Helicobacter didelphidarum]
MNKTKSLNFQRQEALSRREALKKLKSFSLVSLTGGLYGSLSLSYLWNHHKDSSIDSNTLGLSQDSTRADSIIVSDGITKQSTNTESKPHSMLYPHTMLLLSSYLTYSLPRLFALLHSNTPFMILLDSMHTPLLEALQGVKDNIHSINEKYAHKDVESNLDSLMQSLQHHNGLFYIHNPSVGAYTKNEDTSLQTLTQTLRNLMNDKVDIDKIGEKAGQIVKEAYAKLWFYLDMGENKQLESYLRNEVQVNPKYYTPKNITASNNTQVFSKDFLNTIKQFAEWNYRAMNYTTNLQKQMSLYSKVSLKHKQFKNIIAGNLIYDKEYIPTTIDVKD